MAQRTEVFYIDDMTGEPGDNVELVQFVVNDALYEIDLNEENQKLLQEALAPFVEKARRLRQVKLSTLRPAAPPSVGRSRPRVDREQSQAIRDWARARGEKVSDRGRIPEDILAAYHQEN